MAATEITRAELEHHYAKTCLARLGMPLERAMTVECIRLTLENAAKAARKAAARQATPLHVHHAAKEVA